MSQELTPEMEAEIRERAVVPGAWPVNLRFLNALLSALDAAREEAKREKAAREGPEAGAAAMRAALEELADHHCGGYCGENEEARGYRKHSSVMAEVAAAMSTSAGSDLLARLRALEEVADAAKKHQAKLAASAEERCPLGPEECTGCAMDAALDRLAALPVAAGEGR